MRIRNWQTVCTFLSKFLLVFQNKAQRIYFVHTHLKMKTSSYSLASSHIIIGQKNLSFLVDPAQKVAFLFLCSYVSLQTIAECKAALQQRGLKGVWLLDDWLYNHPILIPAEKALRKEETCYFVQVDPKAKECLVYDQIEKTNAFRTYKSLPLQVDLSQPMLIGGILSFTGSLAHRANTSLCFSKSLEVNALQNQKTVLQHIVPQGIKSRLFQKLYQKLDGNS